jgi:hypothetical protein
MSTANKQWVSPSAFIEAWQTANSLTEVAEKLGMTKAACSVRASRYRAQSVPLKEFPPLEMPKTDWDKLAAYARELVPETPPTQLEREDLRLARLGLK